MAGTAISFNGLDLNDTTRITAELDDGGTPERDLQVFPILRSGGAVVTDSNYYMKVIRVRGLLKGTSTSNLESLIDSFHAAMAVIDKNLDIGYAGSTRRYVCTPKSHYIGRTTRLDWAKYEVEFLATSYGKDTSTTTLLNNDTHTTASNTESLTVGGSAPDQLLRFDITVTAATDLTGKTISVENDSTGQVISVTRDWTVGDVLEIDVANHTVKVNGTAVDYEGAFPYFAPGTHDMIMTNDFTTRTLTVDIDYTKRYL